MKNFSFSERMKYKFDNLMSKGTASLIGWLGLISAALIIIVASLVWSTNAAPDKSFLEDVWFSLMRAIDSGTLAGDTGSFIFMLLMLIVTLGGIFIVSILIGILTSGIQDKMESLRRGRSLVIEENHSIILGWSDSIFTLLSELIEANRNQKTPCIVIMALKDKVEMEDSIRERIPSTFNTKIVCRQGSPMDINDLNMLNITTSKTIILNDNIDANTIKTILAITSSFHQRSKECHIVAVIRDPQNVEVAKIAGKGYVEIILADKLISRIVAQTCMQPGLSIVYTELLDFTGDEIYFKLEDLLEGKTFRELPYLYEDSTVIGLCKKNSVLLKPPMDSIIEKGDKIIAISKDDDTIRLSSITDYAINKKAIVTSKSNLNTLKDTLVLGWNSRAIDIIFEMDHYVSKGSTVTVAANFDNSKETLENLCMSNLKNISIEFIDTDITNRSSLEKLVFKGYSHVILLCYKDKMDMQEADAITLITLLHLRDISGKIGIKFSIVSEMLDIRNRKLLEIDKVNDFIISDNLISLMVTQISENRMLSQVYEDLFDAEGSEIYIKPISDYIQPGMDVNFYTLIESTMLKNELVIGYKIASQYDDPDKNYGIYLNPKKSNVVRFTEEDQIIVLAES